jgi:hypothetical protein
MTIYHQKMKSLASMLKEICPGTNNGPANLCYLTSVTLKSIGQIKNPGTMECSLMRPTHNKNFMILASSIHDHVTWLTWENFSTHNAFSSNALVYYSGRLSPPAQGEYTKINISAKYDLEISETRIWLRGLERWYLVLGGVAVGRGFEPQSDLELSFAKILI